MVAKCKGRDYLLHFTKCRLQSKPGCFAVHFTKSNVSKATRHTKPGCLTFCFTLHFTDAFVFSERKNTVFWQVKCTASATKHTNAQQSLAYI